MNKILLLLLILSFGTNAEQDNAVSQRYLATKYLIGDEVLQDYNEAAKLMLKSAQGGDGLAQYNLGVMYLNSYGLKFSPKKAKYWIKKSYENPNTPNSVLESVKKSWNDWGLGRL
ncbi:hypothetical protein N9345_01975 [Candidatus Thioglobus sp.]|nr:hypothetical protein [Candidatus Thioglobus sp.]